MKFLILGSTGLLGQALIKEAQRRGLDYSGVARHNADINIDITNDADLAGCIKSMSPDVVINTCAIVNHQLCDTNVSLAYSTNARPSSILSALSQEYGFKYVYISTDGYFSGSADYAHTEDAPIVLFNEYARTKYAGECFSLTNPKSLVVRTNIVGFRGLKDQPTFVEWVINSLKNKEHMTLFDDYYTSSISVTQFSKALFDLILKDVRGIINLASSSVSSKKVFIEELAHQFGFSLDNTQIGSVRYLTSSPRAESLGLDVSKAENILGYKLPDLQSVIRQLKEDYQHVLSQN